MFFLCSLLKNLNNLIEKDFVTFDFICKDSWINFEWCLKKIEERASQFLYCGPHQGFENKILNILKNSRRGQARVKFYCTYTFLIFLKFPPYLQKYENLWSRRNLYFRIVFSFYAEKFTILVLRNPLKINDL